MKADVWSCAVILFAMLSASKLHSLCGDATPFPLFMSLALVSAEAPFKEVNEHKDWFYHKLFTSQHSVFWSVHCRNHYFSDDAKDLLVCVFCCGTHV